MKNKEWFFSGIGVTIVTLIFAAIRKVFCKKKQEKSRQGQSKLIMVQKVLKQEFKITIIRRNGAVSDETKIIQKAALGSDTTQIGEQNNYYGMTAEEASNLAIKLFMDNFPRLQEEAKKIAKERAEELCKNIVDKLKTRENKFL